MKIPCDTIARLSYLLPDEPSDDPFHCFRLDNGMVLASNRHLVAAEHVGGFTGVFYIRADREMIEQCRTEAQWSSVIAFNAIEAMQWTTAATSMGWKKAENLGVYPAGPTDWDKWRDLVLAPCLEPMTETKAPLIFDTHLLHLLAHTAPSGKISTEMHFDPLRRPTVVRDLDSADWVGFFNPRISDGRQHNAASVPGWCK